jgi:signal transduction histidine kinase
MTRDPRFRPVADGGPATALFEPFPDPLLAYTHGRRTGEDGDGDGAGEDQAGEDADADAGETCFLVRRVNPAFESTFGVAADRVTGRPLDEVGLAGTVVTAEDRNGNEDRCGVEGGPDGSDAEATEPGAVTTVGSILDGLREDAGTAVRFEHGGDDGTRHFRVRDVVGAAAGAGYLLFTEVTELERQRRDLAATVARLERLVGVARHDLRNPLEVAEIRLEAARDTGEDVHFEKVTGSLDRMERIVRDVLSAGGIEPTDAVALEQVARDAWETVDTADATLVVSSGLPTVRGDTDRLQGLFENVFRNSVEHGSTTPRSRAREDSVEHSSTSSRAQPDDAVEHGDPGVTVRVEPIPDGFAVADDGPGVPEAVGERVFEAGYSTGENGTGLGLSIVRQVAREHGWRVSLASGRRSATDAEGGARFEFTGVERVGSDPDPGEPDDRPDDTDGPTERSGPAGPN